MSLCIVFPLARCMLPREKGAKLYGGSVKIRSTDAFGILCIKDKLSSLNSLYFFVFVLNNATSLIYRND